MQSTPIPLRTVGSWTEYRAPNGQSYYFNLNTGVTQWNMPPEMVPHSQHVVASPWRQLYTGDGKLYYHNSVTNISSWEKPADFVEQPLPFTQGFVPQLQIPPAIPGLGNFNAIPSSGASEKPSVYVPPVPGLSDSASLGDSSKNLDDAEELKKKNANVTVIESDPLLSAPLTSAGEFKTAEEARSAFFELFRSVKLKSSMTWQEALPMIINDKRYKALKTLNERKKAFEEYLALLKDEEEKQKAETEKKLISDYIALLDERLSALSFDVDFEASEKILNDDTRCSEFVDKKLKRRVFYDFIDAKKEIEKSKKKLERQKIVDDFKNVLSKVCGDDFNHSWKSVRQKLQDDEAFVRISESLSDSEQQRIFTDLVEDFQTKEASDRHRKRKENRKHNESFKSFLNEVLKRSEIPLHTLMTWTEFLPYIQNDTQYSEFKSLNLIDFKSVFEEFLDDLYERTSRERKQVKKILEKEDIILEVLSFEKALKIVSEIHSFKSLHPDYSMIALRDLYEDALEKKRKQEKYAKQFNDLLVEVVQDVNVSWEEIAPIIENERCYRKLSRSHRQKLFVQRIEKLKSEKGNSNESEGDEDGALPEEEYSIQDRFLKYESSLKRPRSSSRSVSNSRSRSRRTGRRESSERA